MPSGCKSPRLAFIAGGLGFGGATTLLCNLAQELVHRRVPVLVLGLDHENSFAKDFETAGVRVVTQDDRRQILEDRIRGAFLELVSFRPTTVIASLGASSFEVLRYVPKGVRRAGMVHTHHAMCYEDPVRYLKFLDDVIGVSPEIRDTLAAHPHFKNVGVHWLTSGVPVPPNTPSRKFESGQPLRILYLGR